MSDNMEAVPDTAPAAPEIVAPAPPPEVDTPAPDVNTPVTLPETDETAPSIVFDPEDTLGFIGSLEETTVPPEPPPRYFLDTPFTEYTVTEGLLLCILFAFLLSAAWKFVKEVF